MNIKPWVTLTPTRETHDPLPWVGVLAGRVRVGLMDPRVTRANPYFKPTQPTPEPTFTRYSAQREPTSDFKPEMIVVVPGSSPKLYHQSK